MAQTIRTFTTQTLRAGRVRSSQPSLQTLPQRLKIVALAGLTILVNNAITTSAYAETSDDTSWSFEEALEIRKTYDKLIDDFCQSRLSEEEAANEKAYNWTCVRDEYGERSRNTDMEAKVANWQNMYPVTLTSINPSTGVVRVFFNNRAYRLGKRDLDENGQPTTQINNLQISWLRRQSPQVQEKLVFTDTEALIPQQEVKLRFVSNFAAHGGELIHNLDVRYWARAEADGGMQEQSNPGDFGTCFTEAYVEGMECRLRFKKSNGDHFYVPAWPDESEATHIPAPTDDHIIDVSQALALGRDDSASGGSGSADVGDSASSTPSGEVGSGDGAGAGSTGGSSAGDDSVDDSGFAGGVGSGFGSATPAGPSGSPADPSSPSAAGSANSASGNAAAADDQSGSTIPLAPNTGSTKAAQLNGLLLSTVLLALLNVVIYKRMRAKF